MAAAASFTTQDDDSNEKVFGKDTLSSQDKQIMKESYAEALIFMGFKEDVIVHAVKLVQEERKLLTVENVFSKADELTYLKEKGKAFPEVKNKNSVPNLKDSSDGESDSSEAEFMEFCDAPSSLPEGSGAHDLQVDGAQPVPISKVVVTEVLELPTKEDQIPSNPDRQRQHSFLQKKLRALRFENQKLKERQLCRNCKDKSVSITFLPCGHYSYCYDCGQKFTACPVCRKTILADVKTFLA